MSGTDRRCQCSSAPARWRTDIEELSSDQTASTASPPQLVFFLVTSYPVDAREIFANLVSPLAGDLLLVVGCKQAGASSCRSSSTFWGGSG